MGGSTRRRRRLGAAVEVGHDLALALLPVGTDAAHEVGTLLTLEQRVVGDVVEVAQPEHDGSHLEEPTEAS